MSNVSNKSQSPLDALSKLMGGLGAETNRAAGEVGKHTVDDIDSIGKGVETGGFLGGIVQALDVFSMGNIVSNLADAATGPGSMPPMLKEGISAAVNIATGNPAYLKDLLDMATAPSQPGVAPSAPNAVPAPDVEQLRGEPPHAPGGSERTGYTDSPAPPRGQREIHICTEEAAMPFTEMLAAMEFLKHSPECAERFPDIHAALNNDNYSIAEQSSVIVGSLLRDHPELLDGLPGAEEARATIPRGEVPSSPTTAPTAPTAPTEATAPATPPTASTGQGDFSQAGPQLQGMLGGALGFIGNLLSNPMVQGLLMPALGALCAAVPPLQVLIPFLPMIIPMAGQLLSGAGGALSGGAGGASAGGGAAPGGLGGDAFGGMLSSLLGGFGAPAGVPAGSAPVFA